MWTHQRQYESERNMSTKNEETYFATWSDFYHASCPKKREAQDPDDAARFCSACGADTIGNDPHAQGCPAEAAP